MWTYSTTIERHSPLQDRSVLFAWGKYQQHRPKVEDLEVTIWHQLKTRNEGVLTPSYRVEEDIDVERSSHCLGRRRWWGRWLSVHKRWRWMCLENSTNNIEESSHPIAEMKRDILRPKVIRADHSPRSSKSQKPLYQLG